MGIDIIDFAPSNYPLMNEFLSPYLREGSTFSLVALSQLVP